MAYQTGTVASISAIKTLIETFATTNGFSLASNWLSKGINNVKLTANSSTELMLQAANNSSGTVGLCSYARYLNISADQFPITYYLFYNSSPDMLVAIFNSGGYCHTVIFGEIVKVTSGAFTGGNWFFATYLQPAGAFQNAGLYNFGETVIECRNIGEDANCTGLIPFAKASSGNYGHGLHHEIDGSLWDNIEITNHTLTSLYRSPSSFSQQAQLVTISLQKSVTAGYRMYLGYIEHIRFIRVDNYNIGDEITIGSDVWKIFPCFLKDVSRRNGKAPAGASFAVQSGTIGLAIRKTV